MMYNLIEALQSHNQNQNDKDKNMFNNGQHGNQDVMGAKKKNSLPFMRQNSGFENQSIH